MYLLRHFYGLWTIKIQLLWEDSERKARDFARLQDPREGIWDMEDG